MQSRSWLAGILLLVLMNVSCSGKSESGQASTAAAPVAAAMVDAGHLGALVDLIVADAGDLPRAEFDPAAMFGAGKRIGGGNARSPACANGCEDLHNQRNQDYRQEFF